MKASHDNFSLRGVENSMPEVPWIKRVPIGGLPLKNLGLHNDSDATKFTQSR